MPVASAVNIFLDVVAAGVSCLVSCFCAWCFCAAKKPVVICACDIVCASVIICASCWSKSFLYVSVSSNSSYVSCYCS